ncbi:recombination protein RecR [Pedobacter sp. UYP30]|uniref:recombination mediator RecR n=1 Tax=Pedobacter sp. UYP30 TaxID=1756400 RepID=UPI0033943B67
MNFSSKLLEDAVAEFSKLPGIGQKTALRLVLHLLNKDQTEVDQFGNAMIQLKQNIKQCAVCNNISDFEICEICASRKRDRSLVCVVEDTRDVMAIENTGQYLGLYHVLGGLISPMDGVGPADLFIENLVHRVGDKEIKEIILALSPNMEGDTTLFYLFKKLKGFDLIISTIARGIAFGGELEYTDEITLGRSIVTRVPYESTLMK